VLLPRVTGKLDGSNRGGKRCFASSFQSFKSHDGRDTLSLLLPRVAAPAGEYPDGDKDRQANAEIHNDSEVVSADMPRSRRQVGHDEEVHDIPRQHGDERLREIHHGWF
jgi:hypothetical protein